MRRTNLALFGALLVLVGVVAFWDRGALTTDDLEGRSDRLVPELVPERVERIEVTRSAGTYTLVRGPGEDEVYAFAAPSGVRADGAEVAEAVRRVAWAEALRNLGTSEAAERRRRGFADPRLVVTFRVAGRRHRLAFGAETPTGGRFLEVDGRAFVVDDEVADAFDREPFAFRDKHVGTVPAALHRVVLIRGAERLEFQLVDGRMTMRAPHRAWASEGRIETLLGFVRDTAIRRVVAEATSEAERRARLGQVRVRLELGDDVYEVGGPCEGGGVLLATPGGPLVCIDEGATRPLFEPVGVFVEGRALPLEPGSIKVLALADTARTLRLEAGDAGFTFRLGDVQGSAEVELVEALLDGLRATRALGLEPAPPAFAPTFTLRAEAREGGATFVLEVATVDGRVLARRPGEDVGLVYPPVLVERLLVSPLLVRRRELLHEDVAQTRALRIVRAGADETLSTRGNEPMRVVTPLSTAADDLRVADLASRLASLEAVRFAAEVADTSHGLASPAIRVEFTYGEDAEARVHHLDIGASAGEDGRYARLDADPAVFVIRRETYELLASPLARRDPVVVDARMIGYVDVRRGNVHVRVTKDGDRYLADGAPLAGTLGEDAYFAASEIRATRVLEYGTALGPLGLVTPRAEIRIGREAADGPREVLLRVGAEVGEGPAREVYLEAAGVVFAVPATSLGPLLRLVDRDD